MAASPTLRHRIEDNLVIVLFSVLVTGFLAGFGAYRLILEIAKLDTVRKDAYVLRSELPETLRQPLADSLGAEPIPLKNENEQLKEENRKLLERIAELQEKGYDPTKFSRKLTALIDEADSLASNGLVVASDEYTSWWNKCVQLLDDFDAETVSPIDNSLMFEARTQGESTPLDSLKEGKRVLEEVLFKVQ